MAGRGSIVTSSLLEVRVCLVDLMALMKECRREVHGTALKKTGVVDPEQGYSVSSEAVGKRDMEGSKRVG